MNSKIMRRFCFIETQLLFGGGVTASDLAKAFDLSRQTAQATIDRYRSLHPDSLERDFTLKRQVATENFTPYYIRDDVTLFLNHLTGQSMSGMFCDQIEWCDDIIIENLDRKFRPRINSRSIRQLLQALQRKESIYVRYASKQQIRDRTLSPHAIFNQSYLYYVRCYCHHRHEFRNFRFSRFISIDSGSHDTWVSSRDDTDWNTYEDLYFTPNPSLPHDTRQALLLDYNLNKENLMKIRSRRAVSYYIRKNLRQVDEIAKCSLWQEVTA